MPVQLCYEDRGVRCVYTGEVGLPDLLMALVVVEDHLDAARFSYVLHDCTEINRFTPGEGEQILLAVKELDSGFNSQNARAAVIAHDDVALKSFEQCYEMANQSIETFDSLYEAQIWANACTGFADLSG